MKDKIQKGKGENKHKMICLIEFVCLKSVRV